MPELAAIYALGFFATGFLAAVFAWIYGRASSSKQTLRIQERAHSVGWHWSDQFSRFVPLEDGASARDVSESRRGLMLIGALCSLASWVGFGFLLLIFISMRFLARPRAEKAVYASALATAPNLTTEDILREIARLQPDASEKLALALQNANAQNPDDSDKAQRN